MRYFRLARVLVDPRFFWAQSEELSNMIVEVVRAVDPQLKLIGMPNTITEEISKRDGLRFVGEFFADRNYHQDGSLVARSEENALLLDPGDIAQRVLSYIKTKKVKAGNGTDIELHAETICLHGDHPKALEVAKVIGELLHAESIQVQCIP